MYIHTKHAQKIKQWQAHTHDQHDQTQTIASSCTHFVKKIIVSINNIFIDKHNVLNK